MLSATQRAAELLRKSKYTVALTGAGISTPSGIPDFRSERTGLWNRLDPLSVASIWAFHNEPDRFYQHLRPLFAQLVAARPNSAHLLLAQMEQKGHLQAILTQNIDSLHQRAGSRRVLELHGHTRTATCLSCRHQVPIEPLWTSVLRGDGLPHCPQCASVVKPDVVLFGEPLPFDALSASQQEALTCEVMLVIGTSLEVMPAADLPYLAQRRGARVILVNLMATAMDDLADVVIRADVVKGLKALWRELAD